MTPRPRLVAAERTTPDETLYTLQVDVAQIADLAAGTVPAVVRAMACYCLDLDDADRRRAARPERRP